MLRIWIQDEGTVAACPWLCVPGEDAALVRLRGVAGETGRVGLLAGGGVAFAGVLRAAR